MVLKVSIEYKTSWGEQLVLCAGKKRYALSYMADGLWTGEIARCNPDNFQDYGYEVVRDGVTVRREWKGHSLSVPEGEVKVLEVKDRWNDRPADAPFYSSAFTGAIFARNGKPLKTNKIKDINVVLKVTVSAVRPNEVLAIAGSGRSLDDWNAVIPFDESEFPVWTLKLKVTSPFAYKLVIADKDTLVPLAWENGDNRMFDNVPGEGVIFTDASACPEFTGRQWRGAGTAIPVFSLRSEDDFGVGEFYDLKKMVDWAVETGQSVLQLLPINDTTMFGTWEDSYPYNPNSTFALHPQYINLPAAGVEETEDYRKLQAELNALDQIDYERVNNAKLALLREAFAKKFSKVSAKKQYRKFIDQNSHWLMPYAAFCVLRDMNGTPDFSKWKGYAKYNKKKVEAFCADNKTEIDFWCFVQYHLDAQLSEVCSYAHGRGVIFKGDLPIGISRTSVDAWLYPELFHMDSQAGAPPDAFSEFGQNWGFPTYNWERMAKDGFAWWKSRLAKMAEYFDAFRIDHILGFFRIWEIPMDAVHGLLGHFNPAMPYTADYLKSIGFDMAVTDWSKPLTYDWVLWEMFGDLAEEVKEKYIKDGVLAKGYETQRKVAENLKGDDPKTVRIREGLMNLLDDVLFVEDPRQKGCYHPRISAQSTCSFRSLDAYRRAAFDNLYNDFFFHRHNSFWQESAMKKLPELLDSTGMLACGEDLGMIPACVPDVMADLRILSLEIQRMPKSVTETFADPAYYPYLSVCTTSTHDMNPVRAWWEEDREMTGRFYREMLGGQGDTPYYCEPWICRYILDRHLASAAMFTIIPLQDWLSMDPSIRLEDPNKERINVPANSRHYWRYRMHLTLERLMDEVGFNEELTGMITGSGRF